MKSFFSKCKDWFGSDYRGRYLSVVMATAIEHMPSLLKIIFPEINSNGPFKVDVEDSYIEGRLADLVVSHRESGARLLLVEIKAGDEKGERNLDQLKDYVKYVEGNPNVVFYILSRDQLLDKHYSFLKKQKLWGKQIFVQRLSEVYDRIASVKKETFISKELMRFIEEETIIMRNNINEKALKLLIQRACNVRHFHNMGKTLGGNLLEETADTLKQLIINCRKAGELFHETVGKKNKRYTQRPSSSYTFYPFIDPEKTDENDSGDRTIIVDEKYNVASEDIVTGCLDLSNGYSLKEIKMVGSRTQEGRWCGTIQFGFLFNLKPTNTKKKFTIEKRVYAGIKLQYTKGEYKRYGYHGETLRKNFCEQDVLKLIYKGLNEAFEEIYDKDENEFFNDYSRHFPKTVKSQLRTIQKNIPR